MTKADLARRLNVSRTTLDRYLKMEGAPKAGPDGFDQSTVSAWIAEHSDSDRTGAKASPGLAKLKKRELRLKCERLQLQVDAERGKYLLQSEVCEMVRMLAQHQKAVLQRKLEVELPPKLAGLDPIQIGEMMREVVDEVCRIFSDRTQQWESSV